MRLIDADALIDGYKHMGYDPSEHLEGSYMEGWCKGFNAAVDHCMHHVIYAPTIVPERKKGRWLRTVLYYPYCSECDWMPEEDEMRHMNYDFCPGCGSDMREEGEG